MTLQQIAQQWNTKNCGNLAPYGNTNIKKVEEAFYMLAKEMGQTIPLNVGALYPQSKQKDVWQTQNNNAKKDSLTLKQKKQIVVAKDHKIVPLPLAHNLLHILEQAGPSFKQIQNLYLIRWAVSINQEQLAKMALWGCVDQLLKEAWESHDNFFNLLCNLFVMFLH
ncbi:hypothetical protein EDD18DRAFT_1106498 [Armillaria luteobubalina]|uniref:Uncharacterized protein n=1 Tax=Armillaria luteobubalina TaxID=153913 RepID=A0AA39Q2X9_9AGAR|nr:hypothetical protein EDD18DRAFT_1106498 [Armillaria luteobubalina]